MLPNGKLKSVVEKGYEDSGLRLAGKAYETTISDGDISILSIQFCHCCPVVDSPRLVKQSMTLDSSAQVHIVAKSRNNVEEVREV